MTDAHRPSHKIEAKDTPPPRLADARPDVSHVKDKVQELMRDPDSFEPVIEATTYEPQLLDHFAFTGEVDWKLTSNQQNPDCVQAHVIRFVPSDSGRNLGGHYIEPPRPVHQGTFRLPKVESAPSIGEKTFGEFYFVSDVTEQPNGDLLVTEEKVANYSIHYAGERGPASRQHTLPAWFVKTMKAALAGGTVVVRMRNGEISNETPTFTA